MEKIKQFLARKDVVFTLQRYGIDALGAMAQGLFCTLLVGTILNTLGQQFGIGFLTRVIVTVGKGEGAVGYTIGALASAMVGPGIAVAIGFALHCPTRQAGGKGDQNRHSGDARRDGSGRHRHCEPGGRAHWCGGQRRG